MDNKNLPNINIEFYGIVQIYGNMVLLKHLKF